MSNSRKGFKGSNMLKKITALAFCLCVTSSVYALNSSSFNKALNDYATAVSQTAYAEAELVDNEEFLNRAFDKAEKAAAKLAGIVAKIDDTAELEEAYSLVEKFSEESDLNAKTADMANRVLNDRARFLAVSEKKVADAPKLRSVAQAAVPAKKLMKKHQKRLIMIETPDAEATIHLTDTSKNRRVENLEKIFKNHGIRVISSYKNEKEDKYCYYFSGKKYVLDVLLSHFEGSVVNADMKAYVQITTGGFWGGKKKHIFSVGPKRSDKSTMGELAWYKSVVEQDPIKYFVDNSYDEVATLASKEKVAGVDKLLFKNAKIEIWVSAGDKTEADAIYHNKLELGDIYVDAK